ncbi:phosphopantetheine-binding protein [Corynebacterium uberis]|uniref:phosphopantetheine-binding protein n=1 Tax=Corynebacterium TaxID=1716 RepID=UPI001D0A4591|nr:MULTISPECIES: phosphopantetheine-binding protein [Corynebacterium]MCZ9309409.1 phosphopantetheine-binding protein [Corynebacterium sp. c6VSa_13]UDL72959.1 phosphopantetheine-binding protein [Corynebacterium uberis]UDL76164.1 phosphopantetheine-binding protein [Corynebacterium uberis]UDL78376.1 phosphopantetheine-binding protein [Corynebacterium uberis]UDL80659.1 phosphopantetheine-binding protein [Corynebacterium uberis]
MAETTLTRERITADIAEALGITPDEVNPTTPLADQGLDSLRTVMLVENWRADGAEVDFNQIMMAPTLDEWVALLV